MRWFDKWRHKFLEDCAHWWKLWSSWLALIWGMVVTVFWNDPSILAEITGVLPDSTRAYFSPFVFALVAGLPIFVRLVKQQKLIDAAKGSKDEAQ